MSNERYAPNRSITQMSGFPYWASVLSKRYLLFIGRQSKLL